MRKFTGRKTKGAAVCLACMLSLGFGFTGMQAQAEEGSGDAGSGLLITTEDSASVGAGDAAEGTELPADPEQSLQTGETEAASSELTGTYTVPDGWKLDETASTAEQEVYLSDAAGSSRISCSYLDTNYSVLEYEQLRDMLTNNLLYSNVNAQISTSAGYTQAKDYLYIVLVDDSAAEYRSIYYYVVGDYRCFCTQVTEYRTEAEQLREAGTDTPEQVGQKIAEGFVWNAM